MSNAKEIMGERGIGGIPNFSAVNKGSLEKMYYRVVILWTALQEGGLSGHEVCHNDELMIYEDELVYHVSVPPAIYLGTPP